jgi:hypothetical protein
VTNQPVAANDALMLKVFGHGERLERVDNREADHYRDLADRLTGIATTLRGIKGRIDGQADILQPLSGIDERVDKLEQLVKGLVPKEQQEPESFVYEPRPNLGWHKMDEAERVKAAAQLALWVADIFVPGYGLLADMLPRCWREHHFILYHLDALREMWCCLYLTEERPFTMLAAQEDFMIRYLAAACPQMQAEGTKCDHLKN